MVHRPHRPRDVVTVTGAKVTVTAVGSRLRLLTVTNTVILVRPRRRGLVCARAGVCQGHLPRAFREVSLRGDRFRVDQQSAGLPGERERGELRGCGWRVREVRRVIAGDSRPAADSGRQCDSP